MFSSRIPARLEPNRHHHAVERLRAAGRPLIDLTESNPTRVGIDYPPDLLSVLSAPEALIYEPRPFGLPSAREAVARAFAAERRDVPPDRIVLAASTSEAYSLLFKLLCDPGDEVLVPRPSYPLFEYLTALDGVRATPYALEYHGSWSIDMDSVAAALTPATRAILVVNPNNPTGSYLERDELDALADVCREREMALIGDEVFFDYAIRTPPDAVRVLDQRGALAFSLGGLSKSAGLPQLKLGWIGVSGPPDTVSAAMARLEIICDTYLSVSTPVQVAARALLDAGAARRAAILDRVVRNHAALVAAAGRHPSTDALIVEGGWYAVLQVPAVRPEEELALALLERDGVIVHPGYFFDFPREAFLVVSLLPPPASFEEGVRRLLARASADAAV
jgi:hypothetical protein